LGAINPDSAFESIATKYADDTDKTKGNLRLSALIRGRKLFCSSIAEAGINEKGRAAATAFSF
jgi:hypothetical protein